MELVNILLGFPYIDNGHDPKFQNDAIDIFNSRADLRKFLLATSDSGKNIQENINSVVTDGRFNNVALRHLFLLKTSVTFKGANKFDTQNSVGGNLLSQVSASTLTDVQVKKLLDEAEDAKIKGRLDVLRNFDGNNDDEDGPGGGSRGGLVRCIKNKDQDRCCLLLHCRRLH